MPAAPNWYDVSGVGALIEQQRAAGPPVQTGGLIDGDRTAAELNRRVLDRSTGTIPTLAAAEAHYGHAQAEARLEAVLDA